MKPREEDEEHKNRILHHWPITVVKRRRLIDVVDDSVRFIRRPSLKVNNNRSNRGDEARVVIIPGEIHPLHTYGGGNTTTNVGVQQLLQTPPPPPPPPPFPIQDQNLLPTPRLHHHHNNVNLNVKLHHPRYHPNNKGPMVGHNLVNMIVNPSCDMIPYPHYHSWVPRLPRHLVVFPPHHPNTSLPSRYSQGGSPTHTHEGEDHHALHEEIEEDESPLPRKISKMNPIQLKIP